MGKKTARCIGVRLALRLLAVACGIAAGCAMSEEIITPKSDESPKLESAEKNAEHTSEAPDDSHIADVVELPPVKKPISKEPAAPKEIEKNEPRIDTGLDEELIKEKSAAKERAAAPNVSSEKLAPKPLTNSTPKAINTQLVLPAKPSEPGYASVLTGTLQGNIEIFPEALPHLIRGVLIVPAKVTLKINAGAIVHLRGDPSAAKPLQAGSPDPSKSAAVWVYGTLLVCGEGGKPVEFSGQDKDNAQLLFYGGEQLRTESTRFKGCDIAQNGGICQWTNCEFNDAKYYALASGAGQFTHCSFKKCGGIFAAYDEGPWALLVRRCLFENCRDGLLLNRDPGSACLLVEKNNFIGTRGANLRAMPRSGSTSAKSAEELLIGENWYGTTVEEEIDRRIIDRRTDAAIKAHLNTRPPVDKPYTNAGAGAPPGVIAASLSEHQQAAAKMLQALAAKQKPAVEKVRAAMEKTAPSRESAKRDTR